MRQKYNRLCSGGSLSINTRSGCFLNGFDVVFFLFRVSITIEEETNWKGGMNYLNAHETSDAYELSQWLHCACGTQIMKCRIYLKFTRVYIYIQGLPHSSTITAIVRYSNGQYIPTNFVPHQVDLRAYILQSRAKIAEMNRLLDFVPEVKRHRTILILFIIAGFENLFDNIARERPEIRAISTPL